MVISQTPLSHVPPAPPWKELGSPKDAGGYLSFYYSDDMSRLPVRWVTKPGDNKSDPNLETLTYGLFSTCGRSMRSGIVKRRCSHIFFTTSRKGVRIITGYYNLKWYTDGVFTSGDYCLAAHNGLFIEKPIPLTKVDQLCGTKVAGPFRGMRYLTEIECKKIEQLLDSEPDATEKYIEEIDRLEKFNLKHGGYRYIAWKQKEKFSWDYAAKYFIKERAASQKNSVLNTSASGFWICISCNQELKNKALLKRCPSCGALGSLKPK